MATMFSVKYKKCPYHNQQVKKVCLNAKCYLTAQICTSCQHYHKTHGNVLGIDDGAKIIADKVKNAKEKIHQGNDCMDSIRALIQSKKTQIRLKQLDLMQLLNKRLLEQRNKIFQELDKIQRKYQERTNHIQREYQSRNQIISYFQMLSSNQALLTLALSARTDKGFRQMKNRLSLLQKIGTGMNSQQSRSFKQSVRLDIDSNANSQFFNNLQRFLQQKTRYRQIISFNQTPRTFRRSSQQSRISFASINSGRTNATQKCQQNKPFKETYIKYIGSK